jgi:thiamine biosynthesis lipoprotein
MSRGQRPISYSAGVDSMRLNPIPVNQQALDRRELLTSRPRPRSPYWVRVHRAAMACRFEITLSGEDAASVGAAQTALREAARLEDQLSVFRDSSELTAVNRQAAHAPVRVSAELYEILGRSVELSRATDGAFDITSTPLSRCWGFLRRNGRVPGPAMIAAARALVGMSAVRLDPGARTVAFSRPGIELNLGSIGKGHAVQRIAEALKRSGVRHALVSAAGSSVFALGGRGGWAVDVTSRRVARGVLARLRLRNRALATSGAGEQYVDADGTRYGHVLDPRTGWPARGLLSASAIASDAASADALATAFLVGGEDLARRYCGAHPGTMALLTRDDEAATTLVIGRSAGVEVEQL